MRLAMIAALAALIASFSAYADNPFVRIENPVHPLFDLRDARVELPKPASPPEDAAAYRHRAIEGVTQRLLEDSQWWPMLAPAGGEASNAPGVVRANGVFAAVPVTLREVGLLKQEVIGAPVFGPRFRLFAAGTEVWKQYFVLYYNGERDRVNMWCGKRTPPDTARPELTCFGSTDSDWTGLFSVSGSPYFSSTFVKLIELADRARPEIEPVAAIEMPTVTLALTYRGWTRAGPTISADVVIGGVATQIENMAEVTQDERGFVVKFLDGAYRITPGVDAQSATIEVLTPVTGYDRALPEAAARASATRAVDTALARRASR